MGRCRCRRLPGGTLHTASARECPAAFRRYPFTRAGDDLMVLDDRGGHGPNEPNPEMTGMRVPFAHAGELWDALRRGEPVIVADAWSDEPMARAFRRTNAAR